MNAPQQTDDAPGKRHTGWHLSVAALITALALMFILPGFLLGAYSRATGWVWILGAPASRAPVVLYPAMKLAETSQVAWKFYLWEYNLAGGKIAFDF